MLKVLVLLQEKMKEVQDKYKNDQAKLNQEMMELYKKENISPFSGCLTSIIQIVLIIAMFTLVRSPLTYMKKIDNEEIKYVEMYLKKENIIQEKSAYPQIGILKYVNNNKTNLNINLNELLDENKEIEEEQEEKILDVDLSKFYINMKFLGLDLSNIPQENWKDLRTFIIPVLYVLTSIISIKMTTVNNKSKNEDNLKEKTETEEMTNQMSKGMTWFMPIMSISISLIAPLGLALYWLVNNILMIIERIIINKVVKSEEGEQNNG